MVLRAVIEQIVNPTNGHILHCRFGTNNNLILGLLNGKNMRGIAVSAKSFLERTPVSDGFIKKVLADGFTKEQIDYIDEAVMYYNKL